MSSLLNLNSDTSDSEDDQDYVPPDCVDSEDSCSEHSDDAVENDGGPAGKSRSKKGKRSAKRDVDNKCSEENDSKPEEKSKETEVDEKKRVDELFKSFLADVQPIVKKPSSTSADSESSNRCLENNSKSEEKKVVTEEYDFAGETVTVSKKLDSGSSSPATVSTTKNSTPTAERPATVKRPGGGLSSLVGALNKKKKMSTLQKSLLDWNSYKEEEGISEELEHHNKGKKGYIERQAFLQRSDLRQFEIERNLRLSKRGQP